MTREDSPARSFRRIDVPAVERRSDVSDRFVVEADRAVVGIGMRVPGGFRFFSSDPDFEQLEGKVFRRARSMIHRVTKLARLRRDIADSRGIETRQ